MRNKFLLSCLVLALGLASMTLRAQTARSLYFMDNAPARLQLNPALQPMRGYFNLPVVGAVGASVVSNPLRVEEFIDILEEENDFLQNDALFRRLKSKNDLNLVVNTDVLSLGFYSGKGFWTVNVGAKVFVNTSMPKTLFEFARASNDLSDALERYYDGGADLQLLEQALQGVGKSYKIQDFKLSANVFTEVGVGYSRPVSNRLTVGGRVKVLVGAGNLDADIQEMNIQLDYPLELRDASDIVWKVTSKGKLDVSMKGLELSEDEEEEYIDDIDFDSPGVSGYGAGLDLGISYALLDRLTLSASVVDLGFINWSKSSTTYTRVRNQHDYMADEEGTNIFDYDLIKFVPEEKEKGRTTSLEPMLNVGAEYTFLNSKFGVGVLYSNRFQNTESFSELTLSGNYHPNNWFAATVSYSFLHSEGKTLGVGLKFGPIFLASDYLILDDFDSISQANAYLGISIPLGKKRNK